jgi:glyoxylase-like metal-dependent hydrolase (beta-lactamase superfamily II)
MTTTTGLRALRRAAMLTLLAATACYAAAPLQKSQAPGFYRMMVGDFEVTALSDGTSALPVGTLLRNVSAAELKRQLAAAYLKDPVETSFNAFLVNTGSKLVLIDTGAGTLMGPRNGRLLANLQAAGYQPEQVDEVYLTHFHGDHIGGLLSVDERTFPNAVVRADTREAKYWLDVKEMNRAPEDARGRFAAAQSHIGPYVASGQFQTFDGAAAGARGVMLVPGIRALATHGHTPGHTSYIIESRGTTLVVLGDLVHVSAVQLPNPTVGIRFDTDSSAAVAQRTQVFADAAAHGYWVAGAHLSFPGIGHLRRAGAGYVWLPVNYGTQF